MPTYPIITSTENIAGLQELDPTSFSDGDIVEAAGYYTSNDDGGGSFIYDSSSSATGNGGTIIQPSSGSGRWIRLNAGSTVSVRWFGARGDGATDDTGSIQAALNNLGSAKEVIFTRGTYLSGKISPPSNVLLKGDSAILRLKNAANSELISIVAKADIEIKDLTIQGNSANQTGYGSLAFHTYGLILLRSSNQIKLSNCSISDSFGVAINALVISQCIITGNTIKGGYMDYSIINPSGGTFPLHQIQIGGLSHNNRIQDNYLSNSDQGGIGWGSSSPDPAYGPASPGADYVSNGNSIHNNLIDRSQNHDFEEGLYIDSGAPWKLVSLRPLEVAGQRGMLITDNIVRAPTGAFVDGFDAANSRILFSPNRVFRNGQKVSFLKLTSDPAVIPPELESGYFYVVNAGGTHFQVATSLGGSAVSFSAPASTEVSAYCGEPAIDPGFVSLGAQCIGVSILGNRCEGGMVNNPLESNGSSINCLFQGNAIELLTSGACGGGPDGVSSYMQYLNNDFGSMYGPIYVSGGNTTFRGNTMRAGRVGTSLSGSMVASIVVQATNALIEDNRILIDHDKMRSALRAYPLVINGTTGGVVKGNTITIVPNTLGGSYNRTIKALFVNNSSKLFIVDNVFDSRMADGTAQAAPFVLFGSSSNSLIFLNSNLVRNGGGTYIENATGVTDLVVTDVLTTAGTTNNLTHYRGSGGKIANVGLGLGGDLAVIESPNADIGLVAQNVFSLRLDGAIGANQLAAQVNHNSTWKRIIVGAPDSGGAGYRALTIAN